MDVRFIVAAQTPKFIQVADRPLNLGGIIEKVSVEEFQKRFGCIYNDGISIDKNTKITPFRENITGSASSAQLKKQVEKILKFSSNCLVICKMRRDDDGLFSSIDIPKDTVVTIYGGTLIQEDKVSHADEYGCNYYGTNMLFSKRYHRGIASFMQHLPEEPQFKNAKTFSSVLKMFGQNISEKQLKMNVELYSTDFDSVKTRAFLATENIRKEFLNYNGIPLIAMVTARDIKAGEQLGYNYGYEYWLSRKLTVEFFNKNGSILQYRFYKRTFGQLNFEKFTYTGEYRPLIESLNQRKTSVMIVGDDKESHNVSVAKLLCTLLAVNACRIEINALYRDLFYH